MPPKVSRTSTVRATSQKKTTVSSSKSTSKSSSTTSSKSTASRPTTTSTVRSAPSKPASASKPVVSHTTTSKPTTSTVPKTVTVVKTTQPPAQKPRNVDKVDFGTPKPQVDAGVYQRPKLIAAARGHDPEPPKPSAAELEHKRKIESEARKQIEAEKKVEANRNKINAGPTMLVDTVGLITGSKPIGFAGVALTGYAATHQDAKDFTLAEQVAYDNYLYPKHHGYMSFDSLERKSFAKQNQEEIDQVKTEIKKEEDQGS